MQDRESKNKLSNVYTRSQPRVQVSLKRSLRLELLKSTFNTENFICRLFQ